jgi:hypothetical protein
MANTQLTAWLNASLAVAEGREFWMNGQRLILENADEINRQIQYWQRMVTNLTATASGKSSIRYSIGRVR